MNQRYDDNSKEKSTRSDKCNQNCKYRDFSSHRCLYETCIFEELPPTQQGTVTDKCWVCGTTINISEKAFDHNRLCPTCEAKLIELIQKKEKIISHVETPCPYQ